jgi:SPASM domain peptide maturase of grasp-with-spasm system
MSDFNNDKSFKIFTCCKPVKGYKKSIIADVQRNTFYSVPNSLYDFVKNHDGQTVETIKRNYQNEADLEVIESYFSFLEAEDILFYTETPNNFPELSLKWEEPFSITNAIIDISMDNLGEIGNIFSQLNELRCKTLQIRSFASISLEILDEILSKLENKTISSVELVVKYNAQFDEPTLKGFCEKHKRVAILTLHSADRDAHFHFQPNAFGNIFLTKKEITSKEHCGIISLDYFTINTKIFTEAQQHNTCLNRKISIDTEGYIRNCPSMPEHYGNIKDTTLQEAMQHPDFKKYWFIKKDQISVCKDCEFRYICTDCRAYRENPKDLYSKPLKCGYNPYTCVWEEWSTNPLKQKAIDYYGMREIIKN